MRKDIEIKQKQYGKITVNPVSNDGTVISFWCGASRMTLEIEPALELCEAIRKQIDEKLKKPTL